MKLLVLAALWAVALADVSDVLKGYQTPVSSYGVPSGSVEQLVSSTPSPLGFDGLSFSTTPSSLLSGGLSFSTTQSPLFNDVLVSSTPATISGAGISSIEQPINGGFSNYASGPVLGGPSFEGSFGSSGVIQNQGFPYNFDSLGLGIAQSQGIADISSAGGDATFETRSGIEEGGEEVNKHLFFYSAPEEAPLPQARVITPTEPPKKNVKVIFIKAPSFPTQAPPEIPIPKQDKEKTLVYVLVKKPEAPKPIVIPTPPPTQPSKPEVFFIKYNNQKEAEEAINKVQSGVDAVNSAINAHSLSGGSDFISKIGQGLGGNLDASALSGLNDAGIFSTTISPFFQTSSLAPNFISTTPSTPVDIRGSFGNGLTGSFGGFNGGFSQFSGLGDLGSTTISPLAYNQGLNLNSFSGLNANQLAGLGGNFGGIVSTTPSPLDFGGGIVSTTPSSLNVGGGIVSSTPTPIGLRFGGDEVVSTTASPLSFSGGDLSSFNLQNNGISSLGLQNIGGLDLQSRNGFNFGGGHVGLRNGGVVSTTSSPLEHSYDGSLTGEVTNIESRSGEGERGTLADSFGGSNEANASNKIVVNSEKRSNAKGRYIVKIRSTHNRRSA